MEITEEEKSKDRKYKAGEVSQNKTDNNRKLQTICRQKKKKAITEEMTYSEHGSICDIR